MSKAFRRSVKIPHEYNFPSVLVSVWLIMSKRSCSKDLFSRKSYCESWRILCCSRRVKGGYILAGFVVFLPKRLLMPSHIFLLSLKFSRKYLTIAQRMFLVVTGWMLRWSVKVDLLWPSYIWKILIRLMGAWFFTRSDENNVIRLKIITNSGITAWFFINKSKLRLVIDLRPLNSFFWKVTTSLVDGF